MFSNASFLGVIKSRDICGKDLTFHYIPVIFPAKNTCTFQAERKQVGFFKKEGRRGQYHYFQILKMLQV